ncbi:MAG: 1-acyl-sn-glycerol-3-phosphate acyltransferase [Synechococcales bacterium]|nr:1-acyl-sn-glycerol-3-phosphate acyltransferase [Synechococcales bacterium]
MRRSITHARPPLEFIPPDYNPLVLRGVRSLIPFWLRWRLGIVRIEDTHSETLAKLFQQFQDGKVRFLLAFRHPTNFDPLCLVQYLWNRLPHVARQQGIGVKQPTHLHFIYDRGIPLWAGPLVGWGIAHLGATPIRRGSLDTAGLRSIRDLFANGMFPMAAAPEGATNGHNEIVSPMEPGIAQFGFWCVEDLQKEHRDETVLLVPLGIQYRYIEAPWRSLERTMSRIEVASGLVSPTDAKATALGLQNGVDPSPEQETILYQRLYRLGEHFLSLMEEFYGKYYQMDLRKAVTGDDATDQPNSTLAARLQALLDAALTVAEQSFGLKAKGSLTDRCRRVEQAGWDRVYRHDLKQPDALSPVSRGLADLVAEEADLRVWHMRLVENFVSVTGKYVAEKPTAERFADTILLLWKMVAQIKGKSSSDNPKLGTRVAHLTVGEPLNVTERWPLYQSKRRQAIADLTQDLQTAMESLIL